MKSTNQKSNLSRRSFVKRSAFALGGMIVIPSSVLGAKGIPGANDKIGLGFIGVGKQALGLVRRFNDTAQVEIVACSDVAQPKMATFQKVVKDITGKECGSFGDYKELLAQPNIDAVVIATPDHWHAIQSIDSMKAGKDVFCEKPLAHTVWEGRKIVEAVEKYGKVFQTGSMQRSWENFRHAVELVQNGYVGEIKKVLVNVGDPAMACDLATESQPNDINWDGWVGPAQMRGYSHVLAHPEGTKGWAAWRNYKEFGGGILCDWGAHMFDIAQWGLDMDASGPVLLVPPKEAGATRGLKLIYDSGIEMVHEDFGRGWGVRFIGSEGSLDISRQYLDSKPNNIVSKKIGANDKRVYKSENHYTDWLDGIRSRKQPICPAEVGHRTSTICNIANIAYWMKKPLRWDPVKEKFSKDGKANKLLTKKYRKPYKLKKKV